MTSGWLAAHVKVVGRLGRGPGIAVVGLILVLLAACGRDGLGGFTPPVGVPGAGPAAAPSFAFTTFDGERLSLADLAGNAVVLNFWASWCLPCRAEMPYFETTYRAYQDRGVIFVGLAIQDDPASSRAFLRELGITYPAGPDEGAEIAVGYGLTGLPTTAFITRDGKLARKWTGPLSEKQLVAMVEEIAR